MLFTDAEKKKKNSGVSIATDKNPNHKEVRPTVLADLC